MSLCWEGAVNSTVRTEAAQRARTAAELQWFCCTEPWQLQGRHRAKIHTMLCITSMGMPAEGGGKKTKQEEEKKKG